MQRAAFPTTAAVFYRRNRAVVLAALATMAMVNLAARFLPKAYESRCAIEISAVFSPYRPGGDPFEMTRITQNITNVFAPRSYRRFAVDRGVALGVMTSPEARLIQLRLRHQDPSIATAILRDIGEQINAHYAERFRPLRELRETQLKDVNAERRAAERYRGLLELRMRQEPAARDPMMPALLGVWNEHVTLARRKADEIRDALPEDFGSRIVAVPEADSRPVRPNVFRLTVLAGIITLAVGFLLVSAAATLDDGRSHING